MAAVMAASVGLRLHQRQRRSPWLIGLAWIGSLASPVGATGTVAFGTGTLTTGFNDLSTTWNAGDLGGGGTGGLTKTIGAGSFRLGASGSYTFTGAVDIFGSVLVVDGTLAASATNAVNVNGGGTLGGTGTLNRALFVNNLGTVSPGDSRTCRWSSIAMRGSAATGSPWEPVQTQRTSRAG